MVPNAMPGYRNPVPGGYQPDNNFLPPTPDDQDRQYNYYAPMVDIFMRPRLPTLTGPFTTIALSAFMRATPAGIVTNITTRYAIKYAYKGITSSLLYIAGDGIIQISRLAVLASATKGITPAGIMATAAARCAELGAALMKSSAAMVAPRAMRLAAICDAGLNAIRTLAFPTLCIGCSWAIYTIARHAIEPPPYEAPPGCYPNGGPIVEITQEDAPNREMVFTCPAPLARMVQERVLMCERDPTIIQKVKTIASRWCDAAGIQGNQRYAAICGAVAAALTVPINEQLVLQLSQSHAVQTQYSRLARYLSGIKHTHDAWWTKYFSIRR